MKAILLITMLLAGCATQPLKPGSARQATTTWTTAAGVEATRTIEVSQSENPAATTSQATTRTVESTLPIPAKSRVVEVTSGTDPDGRAVEVRREITLAEPSTQTTRTTEEVKTDIGAAQKDVAREIAATARALAPIQYLGMGLVVVALALLYFGWYLPAAIAGGGGLAMIVMARALVSTWAVVASVLAVAASILAVLYAYHKGALDRWLPDNLDHGAAK